MSLEAGMLQRQREIFPLFHRPSCPRRFSTSFLPCPRTVTVFVTPPFDVVFLPERDVAIEEKATSKMRRSRRGVGAAASYR